MLNATSIKNATVLKIDDHLNDLGLLKDVDEVVELRRKLHAKIGGKTQRFKRSPSKKAIDIVINRKDYVSPKQARQVLSLLNEAHKHIKKEKKKIDATNVAKFDHYIEGITDVFYSLDSTVGKNEEEKIDFICSTTSKPRDVIEELLRQHCVPRGYALEIINALRNCPQGHQLNPFMGNGKLPVTFDPTALHVTAHLDNL